MNILVFILDGSHRHDYVSRSSAKEYVSRLCVPSGRKMVYVCVCVCDVIVRACT